MAKYDSTHCGYLLCGKYNLLDVSSKLELTTTSELEDVTPLGAPNPVMQMNVKKNEITGHEGWYDDATTSINALMVGMADTQEVFMFAFEGNTALKHCACSHGVIRSEYKRSMTVNSLTKATMGLSVTGAMDEAHIVYPLGTVTSDGSNENLDLDLGATGGGTTGCNIYLSCTALTLSSRTGFTVTFEDSPDNITWLTQTAMTTLTTAGAEWKASTDQTVNRYVAAKWAWSGSGGTPSATFTLAVKVNNPH